MLSYFRDISQLPSMMDNDIIPYPEDDRMDEGNADDLAADLLQKAEIDEANYVPPTASVDYIDYDKLQAELVNPALSHRLFYMVQVCENRKAEIATVFERVHAEKSKNIEIYRKFHKYFAGLGERGPRINDEWVFEADSVSSSEIESLNLKLKHSIDDGNKEATREATINLFKGYINAGRYVDGIRLYSRCLREYASTPSLVVPMLFDQVKALLLSGDINRVGQYLSQIERSLSDCREREIAAHKGLSSSLSKDLANLAAIAGVIRLAHFNYRQAAEKFVTVEHEFFDLPDLLAPSDIAVYGVLSALATFDRAELGKNVLNNGNFRKFLAPEGQLVDLVRAFNKNSYSIVFDILTQLRPTWSLNIYIAPHLATLFQLIRQRAFVQYCAAFCNIDLVTMAGVFHSTVDDLIDELVILIEDGALQSRIDPIAKQLYQIRVDNLKRNSANLKSLQEDVTHRVRAILVRTALAVNLSTLSGDEQNEMRGTRGRRRGGPATMEEFDDEELNWHPDDVDMINQTRQLSFDQASSIFGNGFAGPSTSSDSSKQGRSYTKFLDKVMTGANRDRFTKKKVPSTASRILSGVPPAPASSNENNHQGDSDEDDFAMGS